ncbi:MAG: DivIVA domain-containing protein [Clostridia bacterium]|nr:DivIVA domain-containing protein [Clostridia bacterium]MEE1025350.1 DivIVA domain-containing protein [Acutalibacteraceae bacterium]
MLTAEKIRGIEFQKSGIGGYKSSDVEAFVEDVATDFETMQKREKELLDKIEALTDMIQEYKNSEDSVKSAILSAQKTGDAILREAEEKAAVISAKSKAESDALLAKAKEVTQQMLDEANVNAREIMDNATVKSKSLLEQAQLRAANIKVEADKSIAAEIAYYNKLKGMIAEFKASVINGYKSHLEALSAIHDGSDLVEKTIEENAFSEEA